MPSKKDMYKRNPGDHVSWVDSDKDGEMLITFDGTKIYNLFLDYPHNMTKREKKLFDAENPFWASFFAGRGDKS